MTPVVLRKNKPSVDQRQRRALPNKKDSIFNILRNEEEDNNNNCNNNGENMQLEYQKEAYTNG